MVKMSEYKPGVPCWVDLSTKDLEGAIAFYGGLFGWTNEVSPDPAEGGYSMFSLDGQPVAGAMGLMSPEQPTVWSSYVSVDDLDKTAETIVENGGQVIAPPMDVTDVGRMGVFVDNGGAFFGCWQPRAFKGAAVVNEPNSWCWNELLTRKPDEVKEFYPAVFGWTYQTNPMGDAGEYTEWLVDGRSIAGMMFMDAERFPAQVPANWNLYFAVADCQASAGKVGKLGGQILVPPTTIPIGTFAVCQDPQGAAFSIIQMAEGSSS